MEALSVLLTQRSKTVQAALSRTLTQWAAQTSSYQNGQTSGTTIPDIKSHSTFRRTAVRHVRHASQSVLEAIFSTVTVSRNVFQLPDNSQRSMIGRALERIQLDNAEPPTNVPTQASELYLTTQTLLTTLPSSAHFVLLPPNIKSYKPYVDLTSSSTVVPPEELVQRLNDWFETSSSGLKSAVERWFSELHSVREVWSVRASIRKWMHVTPDLTEEERKHMRTIFDDVCKDRIPAIWRLSLSRTETFFKERLEASTREGAIGWCFYSSMLPGSLLNRSFPAGVPI
jgi:conserved oligomeric Golgi complex subunit 1